MKIRAEQLQSHLSKELLPVYVISGDEPLLAQESADAVRLAARNKGFSGREVFHGEGKFDWGQLHNEANLETKVVKHCVNFALILVLIICCW